ncbi:MAG: DUF3299 domain-containing protein [Cyanobacteria bacterium P01_G01_bin.4]
MKYLKLASVALAVVLSLLLMPALKADTQQLDWEDLAPQVEFTDPFQALSPEQQSKMGFVYWMIQRQKQGPPLHPDEAEILSEQFAIDIEALKSEGVDIDGIVAAQEEVDRRIEIADNTMVNALDSQSVAIPGYALPLEFAENNLVTEFLLVPYVGACIHVPPPPPNQIVYVETEDGLSMNSLFEPVLVSGLMSVEASKQNLTFVDGSADINVGYTLQASLVEDYDY